MAALVGLAGMDPMRFLESTDDLDIALMQAIAEEQMSIRDQDRRNLATEIANAVWSAVK